MRFKEPILEQPIRMIASEHICENADALSLWLGIPYDEVADRLVLQNGKDRMSIRGYAYEPADPVNPHVNRIKVEVVNRYSGVVYQFDSLYEAAVKLGVSERDLQQAKNGKGPLSETFSVQEYK